MNNDNVFFNGVKFGLVMGIIFGSEITAIAIIAWYTIP